MLNPYVVICATPWLCDAVDMVSLCVYRDLYGADADSRDRIFGKFLKIWKSFSSYFSQKPAKTKF